MKISLLSPVYNEEPFLNQMMDSLRAQTHQDWEALIVDDGSMDATALVAADAAATDPRIKLIACGQKLGKVAAFNLAFEASSGDIIAMVAGDDVLPPRSLEMRVDAFAACAKDDAAVAFFKLRMFSDDRRFDGLTLPRGTHGSRSGPSITLNRVLANRLFPIPAELVSEDIWLGDAAEDLATTVIECSDVVVNYRVHSRNSNPRHKSFSDMSESMHLRLAAHPALLNSEQFTLSPRKRASLDRLVQAEALRYRGKTASILILSGIPVIDRLAIASMSNAMLHRIRTKFYKFFSGRRKR